MSQIESPPVTDKTRDVAAGAPGDATTAGARLHMGIAEQGKVYALAGKHALALQYYRHAIHMAVQAGDPEIFFRHYLECVMESLEQMGAHVEVLAYCEKAVAFYGEHPPTNLLEQRDLAHVYERQGAVLLKSGDKEGAAAAFEQALMALQREVWPRRQVLYLIWRQPWMSVSRDTYIARMLALVGWETLPVVSAARYPELALDRSLLDAADWILFSSEPYRFQPADLENFAHNYACPVDKLRLIDGEMTSWYGSRALSGLAYLAHFARTGFPPANTSI